MKKQLKTMLVAGFMAGLMMIQPVYGAEVTSAAVKQVIRMDAQGVGHPDNAQENSSDVNALPPEEQAADTNALAPAEQAADTNALVPAEQAADTNALAPAEQAADTNALAPAEQAADTNALAPAEQAADTNALAPAEQAADTNALAPAEQAADTNALAPTEQTAGVPLPPADTAATQNVPNLPAGIRALDPTKPMIALTYDDGPFAAVGNRIMDVMNLYGGKCTFFMVGNRVTSYAAEVQRMAREGFEVANHTQDHPNLKKLGAAQIQAQVNACNDVIQAVSGVRPTVMRLPGGNKNNTVLANTGMPIILWNIDTNDWKTKSAQATVNAVLGKVKDGDIVLMHELYSSTAAATETLVPALVSQGFQLVTVSELAFYKGKTLTAGQVYYSIR